MTAVAGDARVGAATGSPRAAPRHFIFATLAGAMLLAGGAACAQEGDALVSLINAYRSAPGPCNGRPASPVPPLAPNALLARVRIGTGTIVELALEQTGYRAERAATLSVSGATDAPAALAALEQNYCQALLSTGFSDIGAIRTGNEWLVVLAEPSKPPRLSDWPDAGQTILAAVNAARATSRQCGSRQFGAAPPLAWNAKLADAALEHSREMATQKYLSHEGKDGSVPGDRALKAGYRWLRVGENIAVGQTSPQEAVAGWLSSPGHCANLMNRDFTEMGAAYGVTDKGRVYWTQVFGTPR
jgi:uncharacterized protein YkwD